MSKYDLEREELGKKIYDCKENCKPWFIGVDYCSGCQEVVINFLNKYGAGVLMGDLVIDDLKKENQILKNQNNSLNKQLQDKINQINKLKEEMKNNDVSGRSS